MACAVRIERELGALDGVSAVRVGVESRTVAIYYDAAKLNVDGLIAALSRIGFTGRIAKRDSAPR